MILTAHVAEQHYSFVRNPRMTRKNRWLQFRWARPEQFAQDPLIFDRDQKNVNPDDIRQGEIGLRLFVVPQCRVKLTLF